MKYQKIYYKSDNIGCIETFCEYRRKINFKSEIKVGSYSCASCEHHIDINNFHNFVLCSADYPIDDKNQKLEEFEKSIPIMKSNNNEI